MADARVYQASARLGAISHDQFNRALARFDLGELIAIEQVRFGLFGQNVFLTSTAGEFVFRGSPHFPWQFPWRAPTGRPE